MGKRAQPHPFQNNPFLEGFADWMDSPEGDLSGEVCDTVLELLDSARLDAHNRKILWEDGKALDIAESIECIHAAFPTFPPPLIETHVLAWLESGFVPQGYSQEQLAQFDALVERWLKQYRRKRHKR